MHLLLQVAISVLPIAVYYFLKPKVDPIPDLPGPESSSWFYGNLAELLLAPDYGKYEFTWLKRFGSVYQIRGCFGRTQIVIADPVAMHHVFSSPKWDQAPPLSTMMWMLFGSQSVEGFRAGGPEHRHLRGALNGAFTASVVQSYESIFERIAAGISERIESSPTNTVDIADILSDATLSAISLALLSRPVEELDPGFVQLNTNLFRAAARSSKKDLLSTELLTNYIPRRLLYRLLHFRVAGWHAVIHGRDLGLAIGRAAVEDKLRAQASGEDQGTEDVYDLLLSGKAGATNKKLDTEELIAQTTVLLVAGQDTTANTLAFTLIELARNPALQDQLRTEIHARAPGQSYNQLPLLNAVVKEALRMFPAEPVTDRLAYEDDIIPLSAPVLDRHGRKIECIPVRKGQVVTMAIASYQRWRWRPDGDQTRWISTQCDGWREARSRLATSLVRTQICEHSIFHISSEHASHIAQNELRKWITNVYWMAIRVGRHLSIPCATRSNHPSSVMEMQIILCELVGKFSFSIPPGTKTVARLAHTLLPLDEKIGEKAAMLQVRSV
ncbi:unnamed protein product [Mycena citricolor]|uniref:Cytochrome P450 n=1 Tax=Mycena citricolor TaxID=2018698 RepID=A0AAD2H1J0_9AGAR|nr:unnamed protein product [Mycena citricolor]